jgi:hypothetical protein
MRPVRHKHLLQGAEPDNALIERQKPFQIFMCPFVSSLFHMYKMKYFIQQPIFSSQHLLLSATPELFPENLEARVPSSNTNK